MHIEQLHFTANGWTNALDTTEAATGAQLVFVFGDRTVLSEGSFLAPLQERFPEAAVVSCSGGGAIMGGHALDDALVATAVQFNNSTVRAVLLPLASADTSESTGVALGRSLPPEGLRHVFVFAEGLHVNGTALSSGLTQALPAGVSVTGGLAADGDRFERTIAGLDCLPVPNHVVAVGLYGDDLQIGTGSFAGWEPFGIDRLITRASGNTLFELDGQPALAVYKGLLGPLGYALPASGLLFPLKVRASQEAPGVIRTILGVDEEANSVTFAGEIPEGSLARLVRTDLDQLIRAAGTAAERTGADSNVRGDTLVLAVSCIGRKLLLQKRVDEEIASVRRVIGEHAHVAGFYSYGELAPSGFNASCELHNQTMTLTTITEA